MKKKINIGADIVQVSRISRILESYQSRFLKRFFNSWEIEESQLHCGKTRISYLAKRFAAKEAIIKARGHAMGLELKQISIRNNCRGKPFIYFKGRMLRNSQISLSDDGDYALAFVILGDRI
ncbi:holo-[acyl-carrier-protein] synthase [Neorickettsia helminthoeca str. Oregon]|uniref:Holo-[acyl-carrier-protein] synthase n=1 Tax=Neorickettsia helminthoeca str. Oregon TaxID=1286528 RepID=X5GXQ8_9RICK|nr:holo-ACP synthase [Neorickettsia helminthoeca]AHX11837.1 holo-[acyl-carrier-protein] synthase [Neorickettsia helminthoeca str. Oregon]